jgi:hypothetical protein
MRLLPNSFLFEVEAFCWKCQSLAEAISTHCTKISLHHFQRVRVLHPYYETSEQIQTIFLLSKLYEGPQELLSIRVSYKSPSRYTSLPTTPIHESVINIHSRNRWILYRVIDCYERLEKSDRGLWSMGWGIEQTRTLRGRVVALWPFESMSLISEPPSCALQSSVKLALSILWVSKKDLAYFPYLHTTFS